MTPRQHQTLTFIRAYIGQHGSSPTYAEIADQLECSVVRVARIVRDLQRGGHISHTKGRPRSIAVNLLVDLAVPLREAVEAHCAATGKSPAALIGEAVAVYFTLHGDPANGSATLAAEAPPAVYYIRNDSQ